MRRCFADTFYFLALLNDRDAASKQVAAFNQSFDGVLVTTDWILTEVADAMCGISDRPRFAAFLRFVRQNPKIKIVRASAGLFDDGLELYLRRRDKEWSLTDCISFVVMKRQRLTDALTGDHHFAQAGFTILFKDR
jgi:predicted nucleic acid-binding protein